MSSDPNTQAIGPRDVVTGVVVTVRDVLRFLVLPVGLVCVLAAFVGVLHGFHWLLSSAPAAVRWPVWIAIGVPYLVATMASLVGWFGRRGAQHRRAGVWS